MKISINRISLLKSIQNVMGAIERRHTLPILSNILFVAEGDTLSLTGTDLEIELVNHNRDVSIITEGRTTIPAKKLMDIVRSLPDDQPLVLSADESKAILTQGKRKYTFQNLSATEYPDLDAWEADNNITIPANALVEAMSASSFSMANQDVRYYLNGMLFELTKEFLFTVGTDGHRLAMSKLPIPAEERTPKQVIIPRKSVMEMTKLIGAVGTSDITLTLGQNHLRIAMADLIMTTKLIDGKFPDYKRVIPKANPHKVTVDREALKGACSRAAILSNEKYKGCRLTFEADTITVYASNPEHEVAEESVESASSGDLTKIEVGFNVIYLLDVLNAIKADTVVLELMDQNSASLVYGENSTDARYVLMPMRL